LQNASDMDFTEVTCKMQVFYFGAESGIVMPMETLKQSECRSCCPVANALDVLGDRWTLLVIRDMMFMNKHEFGEFMKGPEKIATNILTDRLKCLQDCDVIAQLPHPKHKNKKIYYLTQKGKDLLPVLVELILWGGTYRAAPDMPKAHFNHIKRQPKKFVQATLRKLKVWEDSNL